MSLFNLKAACQEQWPDAASASLGGCYVTMQGSSSVFLNQAGLGFIEQSSVCIQHSMPYLVKELGLSSISGQFRRGSGAVGIALASRGIIGFRQTSMWLAYGMKLHPSISAGLGIHLWNYTIAEQYLYAPGISFALGLQIRIDDQWTIGGSLFHPAGWSALPVAAAQNQMSISAGLSYSFLGAGCFCSEMHIHPLRGISLCNGVEWIVNQHFRLRTGIYYRPFTFSCGAFLKYTKWRLEFSFQYRTDTGLSPLTSITHAW